MPSPPGELNKCSYRDDDYDPAALRTPLIRGQRQRTSRGVSSHRCEAFPAGCTATEKPARLLQAWRAGQLSMEARGSIPVSGLRRGTRIQKEVLIQKRSRFTFGSPMGVVWSKCQQEADREREKHKVCGLEVYMKHKAGQMSREQTCWCGPHSD